MQLHDCRIETVVHVIDEYRRLRLKRVVYSLSALSASLFAAFGKLESQRHK